MTGAPVTLESLAFNWGDAYLFSYARDRWVALRRDRLRFLTAETLTGLEQAIEDDHRDHPVPRHFDPPGAADYLDLPKDGGMAGRKHCSCWPRCATRPVVDHHLRRTDAGLDRPDRRKDHLRELRCHVVRRADADRGQGTPGPAWPRLGPAPLAWHLPVLGPRPALCAAPPCDPL